MNGNQQAVIEYLQEARLFSSAVAWFEFSRLKMRPFCDAMGGVGAKAAKINAGLTIFPRFANNCLTGGWSIVVYERFKTRSLGANRTANGEGLQALSFQRAAGHFADPAQAGLRALATRLRAFRLEAIQSN